MKISLSEAFDELDINNTNEILQDTHFDFNEKSADRIKAMVFDSIGVDEVKPMKKNRIKFKRALALIAIIAIIGSASSVGAANYFVPDNALNQVIELSKDVDYSTLGTDVNQVVSSKGLDFEVEQILCDNDIMIIPIKCPKYNGKYVCPTDYYEQDEDFTMTFTIDGKPAGDGVGIYHYEDWGFYESYGEGMCCLIISGIKNIRNNSDVSITWTHLDYFNPEILDDEGNYELCDVKGYWNLNFKINRSNVRTKLKVNDFVLGDGEKYRIKDFVISPLGFRCNYDVSAWKDADTDGDSLINFPRQLNSTCTLYRKTIETNLSGADLMTIEMKDGTVLTNGDGKSEHFDLQSTLIVNHNTFMKGTAEGVFRQTINVEDIKTIKILDQVLYEA